jgi:hypothetical protein
MVEVWVRYKNLGKLNKEQECTVCGKTIKDPRFKAERERHWQQRKKKWQDKKKKGTIRRG